MTINHPILLNQQTIYTHLCPLSKNCIHTIRIEDSVTSTNDILLSTIKNDPRKNTVLLAESQSAGRGRLDKKWISPAQCNIYLSLSWYFEKSQADISGLSVTVGECVLSALKDYGITETITLKWPNDLLYQNQKLCGILVETMPVNSTHSVAIIGIGLNVNYTDENNPSITQPWTSLKKITQQEHDRNKLIAYILNALSKRLFQMSPQ